MNVNVDNDSSYWVIGNDNISRRCAVEPLEKPWVELTNEEKIERLRERVKYQEKQALQEKEWQADRMVQLEHRIYALEHPDMDKKAYI